MKQTILNYCEVQQHHRLLTQYLITTKQKQIKYSITWLKQQTIINNNWKRSL